MIKTRDAATLRTAFNRSGSTPKPLRSGTRAEQCNAPDGATPGTAPKPLKLTRPEPREADIQREIVAALRMRGWIVTRINANNSRRPDGKGGETFTRSYITYGFPKSGFPDLIALRSAPDGTTRALLLEVKTAKGKLRPNQEDFQKFAAAYGVPVFVVRSAREALAAIEATAPSEPAPSGTAPA